MKIKNSEICQVDGKDMTYFRYPMSLFNQIEKTLNEIGPEKFFSSPYADIKKVRESMAEYFFALALKKMTKKDWLIMQPEKEFPDFVLISVGEGANKINLEQFELVEVMNRCKTFDEMLGIVNGKINKGYPENYNLLIFINHEMSKEWIPLLHKNLGEYYPFKAIWTVYLLFKGENNPFCAIVNRIRPLPILQVEANFTDPELYTTQSVPYFIETQDIDGDKILNFKKEFIVDLIKEMRRNKLR